MYQVTTATKKLLKLSKRIRGVSGGTSASKTISILMILIDYCQSSQKELVSVVSETYPHLKRGAMRDFQLIMEDRGYWRDDRWNKTDCIYEFETGSKLEFFSADQPSKVKGPRRDILFINEASSISFDIYNQLEVRTKKIIWLDWNPSSEFWFYTDIKGGDNVDFITLTYKDNEALDPRVIASIESRKTNSRWWRVYGEGLLGEAGGRIYKDWEQLDEIPHEARLEKYGLDFGYTNDPTAIIAVYKYNGGYIFDEVCYQYGMSNKDISDTLMNLDRRLVVADSAEPKSIDEISSYGINILASPKGSGSVLQGIQFIQDQRISVTKTSLNLIREYRNYMWKEDKDGKILNIPCEGNDHALDAIRYALSGSIQGQMFPKDTLKGFEHKPLFDKWGIPLR